MVKAESSAPLTADRQVKSPVTLCPEIIQTDVLTHLHSILNLDSHGLDNLDLGQDDILLQLVGRDPIGQHPAGHGILLKYGRRVPHLRQIKGTGESGGACAHNGDFFVKMALCRGNNLLWDITGLFLQVQIGQEFLDLINCDRIIDPSSGTLALAPAVTDSSANGRQGVVLLDESQSLLIAPLRRHLQIALDGDMSWAGSLAGSGAGLMAVHPVVIPVVFIPHLLSPLMLRGKDLSRIADLCSIRPAELLSQLQGPCRTVLDAASAGHTFLLVYMGHVGGP